jgi:hypothetical protein
MTAFHGFVLKVPAAQLTSAAMTLNRSRHPEGCNRGAAAHRLATAAGEHSVWCKSYVCVWGGGGCQHSVASKASAAMTPTGALQALGGSCITGDCEVRMMS